MRCSGTVSMTPEPLLNLSCPKCGTSGATLTRFREWAFDVTCVACGESWTVGRATVTSATIKVVQTILLMRDQGRL